MASPSPLDFYKQRMRSIDRRRLLRPMRTGEIIDLALRCYQVLARPILRLTLIPMLFCYAGLVFVATFVLPQLVQTSQPDSLAGQVSEVLIAYGVGLAVALPLFVVGLGYASGLTVRLVSDFILGDPVSIVKARDAAAVAAKSMTKLLFSVFFRSFFILLLAGAMLLLSALLEAEGLENGVVFLLASITSVGAIVIGFLAVPIVLCMYALCPQVAVIEGLPSKACLNRSRALMKSHRYQTGASESIIGIWLIMAFVALAIYFGAGLVIGMTGLEAWLRNLLQIGPAGSVAAAMLEMLPAYITLWLVLPIWSAVTTILYYDRRVRLEALDIWMLADDVLKADRKTVLLS